jgi:hypothetical protein
MPENDAFIVHFSSIWNSSKIPFYHEIIFSPSIIVETRLKRTLETLDGVIHTAPRDFRHQPQLRHGKLLNPQRIRL